MYSKLSADATSRTKNVLRLKCVYKKVFLKGDIIKYLHNIRCYANGMIDT